jgi:hypothetical protein
VELVAQKLLKYFVPLIGNLTTFQRVLDRVTRNEIRLAANADVPRDLPAPS